MVRLDDIELEVLARVFEYVVDTSPKSAFSFACTSKYYYSSYQLVSHRDKRITYFQHPQSRDHLLGVNLDNWLADSNIIRGLRQLSIDHAWFSKDDTCDPNRPQLLELVTLLQKLSRLAFLDWNIALPIPPSMLDALHKYQPDAELRVFYFTRDKQTGDENDPDEIALSNSPALTAIRTSLYQNGHYPDLRLACFQRIVASAPNLRFASVSEIQAQGCLDFSFSEYQKRAIKTLAKKFHAHQKPNPALRRLVLDGWEVSRLPQAEWGKFLDLAQLEDIKISGGRLDVHHLPYAAQVLRNLKHLSLDLRCTDTVVTGAVHDFLTSLAPLRSLSLSSWMESVSLDAILLRHGSTLETLHLHELEHDESSRQLLTAKEVERIRVDCPNLRDVTIDCTRHSETLDTEIEVDDVLYELAQMRLAKLQIYYDLGLKHLARDPVLEEFFAYEREEKVADITPGPATQPTEQPLPPSSRIQIEAFAGRLWKYIFSLHPLASSRVLELKFGEWERKIGGGLPVHWAFDEQNRKSRWLVKPHERDDSHGEYVVVEIPKAGWKGHSPWRID